MCNVLSRGPHGPAFVSAFDCQGLDPGTVWILIAEANRARCSDKGPGGSRAIPMCGRGRHHGAPCKFLKLLPDSEPVDQLAIAGGVLRLQIIEQAAALADQLQQSAARVVVLL